MHSNARESFGGHGGGASSSSTSTLLTRACIQMHARASEDTPTHSGMPFEDARAAACAKASGRHALTHPCMPSMHPKASEDMHFTHSSMPFEDARTAACATTWADRGPPEARCEARLPSSMREGLGRIAKSSDGHEGLGQDREGLGRSRRLRADREGRGRSRGFGRDREGLGRSPDLRVRWSRALEASGGIAKDVDDHEGFGRIAKDSGGIAKDLGGSRRLRAETVAGRQPFGIERPKRKRRRREERRRRSMARNF